LAGKVIPAALGWFLLAPGVAGTPAVHAYKSRRLGVSFPVPSGWRAGACGPKTYDEDREHCVLLWDRKDAPLESPAVIIHVRNGGLEEGFQSDILFERVNGKWMKRGKFSTVECVPLRSRGWSGYYGVADCGMSDELGQHTGECLSAVLSDGHRYADIEVTAEADKDLVLDQVIRQFQFLP